MCVLLSAFVWCTLLFLLIVFNLERYIRIIKLCILNPNILIQTVVPCSCNVFSEGWWCLKIILIIIIIIILIKLNVFLECLGNRFRNLIAFVAIHIGVVFAVAVPPTDVAFTEADKSIYAVVALDEVKEILPKMVCAVVLLPFAFSWT